VAKGTGEATGKQLQALSTLGIGVILSLTASWQIGLVTMTTIPITVMVSVVRLLVEKGRL